MNVGHSTFIHKHGVLALADDESCAHFDFVLITRKAVGQNIVFGRLGPLDDVNKLAA